MNFALKYINVFYFASEIHYALTLYINKSHMMAKHVKAPFLAYLSSKKVSSDALLEALCRFTYYTLWTTKKEMEGWNEVSHGKIFQTVPLFSRVDHWNMLGGGHLLIALRHHDMAIVTAAL